MRRKTLNYIRKPKWKGEKGAGNSVATQTHEWAGGGAMRPISAPRSWCPLMAWASGWTGSHEPREPFTPIVVVRKLFGEPSLCVNGPLMTTALSAHSPFNAAQYKHIREGRGGNRRARGRVLAWVNICTLSLSLWMFRSTGMMQSYREVDATRNDGERQWVSESERKREKEREVEKEERKKGRALSKGERKKLKSLLNVSNGLAPTLT